jgi:hypothetical protein
LEYLRTRSKKGTKRCSPLKVQVRLQGNLYNL